MEDTKLNTSEDKITIKRALEDFDALLDNMNDNNFAAKVIAAYIRNNMEDFHCKHLNDEQMKELNPIIRNAIFTALEDISKQNYRILFYSKYYVPEYWEDCEYLKNL